MRLTKVSDDVKLEETILMGMIVSSEFLADIRPMVDHAFFTSSYAQELCNWTLDYFDNHQKRL